MKKHIKTQFILLFASFACQFSAFAQTPDNQVNSANLILKNYENVLQVERALGIPSQPSLSKDIKIPGNLEERLKNIQNTLRKNNLQLAPQKTLQGGVDSGGGNLVLLKSGRYRLLEFSLNNGEPSQSPLESIPAIPIKETKALRAWGIDRLDSTSTIYTETIQGLLRNLETTSPFTAALINSALFHMPVYIVNYELGLQDSHFYVPTKGLSSRVEKIVTGAIYFKNFGVFVSKKHFDLLPFEDQVGLLIHESLRHLQITHGFQFSDKDLQDLTQALVQSGENPPHLDSPRFLNGKIRNAYFLVLDREIQKILWQLQAPSHSASDLKDPFAAISATERDLSLIRQTNFNYLDRIIKDYETKGWTPFKSEAHTILQLLEEQKIIRLTEAAR